MPLILTNTFAYMLYAIAFLSINLLETVLIIRDLYYWKSGRLENVKTHKKDWLSIIILTLVILAALNGSFWVVYNLRFAQIEIYKWDIVILGVILVFIGIIIRIWSVLAMGKFFRLLVLIQEKHEIVTKGPYRFVRHPSYTGAILTFIGVGLCLSNFLAIVICLALPFIAYIQRIYVEEEVITKYLGKSYLEYKKQVRWKLFPYIY